MSDALKRVHERAMISLRHGTRTDHRVALAQIAGIAECAIADAAEADVLDRTRIERLEGLLKECMEMADNWPSVAYTMDLECRVSKALRGWTRTFGPRQPGT